MKKLAVAIALVLLLLPLSAYTRTAAGGVTAYLNRTTWVYAKPSTSAAKVKVAKGTRVTVLAVHGSWAWIQKGKAKGYIFKKYLSARPAATPTPRPTATPKPTATSRPTATPSPTPTEESVVPSWRRQVEKLDWFKGGNSLVRRGGYATLYDIDTGISLRIKRKGGTNHMDVEPATASDTGKLRRIAGGTFSWKSHAVVLIKAGRYIAAAINTMPHGDQTIKDNDFPGQFCLHMAGAKTHGTDRVNPDHQASIDRVMKWAER